MQRDDTASLGDKDNNNDDNQYGDMCDTIFLAAAMLEVQSREAPSYIIDKNGVERIDALLKFLKGM